MGRIIKLVIVVVTLYLALPVLLRDRVKWVDTTAQAIPAWSRKFNADCTLCHTAYPRLNRTGYEFKRLGYRFAWEVAGRNKGQTQLTSSAPSEKSEDKSVAPSVTQETSRYVTTPSTESSLAGAQLYEQQSCSTCHVIGKEGGLVGPRLDGISARRNRAFLIGHITDPQAHARNLPMEHPHGAMMPVTNATAAQIAQVADYLLTLPESQETRVSKTRIQDYLAVTYAPSIEIENENGETTKNYATRALNIYAAGPVGRNFSFFVQPLPLSQEKGFLGKFEMIQGLLNFGGTHNFTQARIGQIFNLRNAGFGGTDRGLTETLPLIFQPGNGFNPSGLGRGASVEYTLNDTTTFKAFANSNELTELGGEVVVGGETLVPESRRSHAYGLVYEQVLGKTGLSGIQFQFAGGSTPLFFGDARQPSLRFQRYSVFVNKTFQDKRNFERVNVIFGSSLLRDSRFLGVESERRSRGYGYFAEVDTIPVPKHLTMFARYDQLRPTTLISGNTLRGGTLGVLYDPFTRHARVSFEYQRLGGARTVNAYHIGFQLNF